MIHMIVPWCCVMDCPADQSEFYREVCNLYGEETANAFTFEQVIPPICTTGSSKPQAEYGNTVGA